MKKIVKLFGVMTIAAALLISCKQSTGDENKTPETPETPTSEPTAPETPKDDNETAKEITVSLKGSNLAAYGATSSTTPTENEDGSCTYETSGMYSGGGMYFYINEDKSTVDLTGKVIKVEAEIEKTAWSLSKEPNFCLNVSDKESPSFWSDFKTLGYFDSSDNKVSITKAADADTKITCVGIKLNTHGTDATEADKIKVTIKSIKIIDAE